MSAFCLGNNAAANGVRVYWPMRVESKGRPSRGLRGVTLNSVGLERSQQPDIGV
jgi:hypothetical protein